jgi:hypothetical protein
MLQTKAAGNIFISYVVFIMGRFLPLTFGVAPGKKFTRIAADAAVWELGTGEEYPHTSLQREWKCCGRQTLRMFAG